MNTEPMIMTAAERTTMRREAHEWLSAQEIISHDIKCDCLSCYTAITRYYS